METTTAWLPYAREMVSMPVRPVRRGAVLEA
jgi:hypothetical protein